MDCPSEEAMIRMKLEHFSEIKRLDFDIANRKLEIYHEGGIDAIHREITDLKFEETLLSSVKTTTPTGKDQVQQRELLWSVLLINFAFFIIEITTGWLSASMGLIADSLDMLADSFVYALSLFAVGGSALRKKKIASAAGYFQLFLAAIGFLEILRRFFLMDVLPDFKTIIIVSVLALLANALCLYLLHKSKSKEAHMQASMIFTSNDVVINLGVLLSGLLVLWTNSRIPDLIVGGIVFVIVLKGALRILKLGK